MREALRQYSVSKNDDVEFLNLWPQRKTLKTIKFLQNFMKLFIFRLGFIAITW